MRCSHPETEESELRRRPGAIQPVRPAARTIATIRPRTASDSFGHAVTTAARSGSERAESALTAPDSAPLGSATALFPKEYALCSSPVGVTFFSLSRRERVRVTVRFHNAPYKPLIARGLLHFLPRPCNSLSPAASSHREPLLCRTLCHVVFSPTIPRR